MFAQKKNNREKKEDDEWQEALGLVVAGGLLAVGVGVAAVAGGALLDRVSMQANPVRLLLHVLAMHAQPRLPRPELAGGAVCTRLCDSWACSGCGRTVVADGDCRPTNPAGRSSLSTPDRGMLPQQPNDLASVMDH